MSISKNILENLLAEMELFETQFPLKEMERTAFKQTPDITLLTCSDSRMPPNMLGPTFNRVFSVENIGNQFSNNAGSVLYGLLHLRTPIFIVAGHTDCGAVKAALGDFSTEPFAIRKELHPLLSTLSKAHDLMAAYSNKADDISITRLAEFNVDMQIKYVLENDEVRNLIAAGQLAIMGIMVDLHNTYENGYGKIYLSNYNGETETDKIRQDLSMEQLKSRVRRLGK